MSYKVDNKCIWVRCIEMLKKHVGNGRLVLEICIIKGELLIVF